MAQTAYANDWVDPDYILAKNFGPHTARSQAQIILWAHKLAIGGPWSVMNKTFTPPSGNNHDYMSLAPSTPSSFWWPDCAGVGNTTVLTEQQVWTTCPYKQRDGQFNPDARTVNNVGDFQDMSEAVFYNTMAWVLNTDPYERGTFEFNADETKMNPNMNFAQMKRGPEGQIGYRAGILDLKGMVKISNAILMLRKGKASSGRTNLIIRCELGQRSTRIGSRPLTWDRKKGRPPSNSTSFKPLAALKILNNDLSGAKATSDAFFNTLFMDQITSKGEQPLEAIRTRPYHYRAYNLAALVTNARLAHHADRTSNIWNKTTKDGANIKSALDFAMTVPAGDSGESKYASELHPIVAAAAAVYGDSDSKYLAYMKKENPLFIFWTGFHVITPSTNQNNANGKTSGAVLSSKLSGLGLWKRMVWVTALAGVVTRRL
ncbi:alginate lyase-domain-containing protein [Gymnopilus junonius]|uniref:Alginate lyase-domain-containing protein n=1 Tax=Gymnopilus junonius TaxID=109634 RepID=A0A9P5NV45_GYMJU|nr:alginate lyase-domain-containing protein [Gymnopilus junonius]